MALHFYINGTAGAKDGTMLSGGDLSSCLTTEGFEVASEVTVSKTYDVCVRADEGEVWKFCPVSIVSDNKNTIDFVRFVSGETPSLGFGCYGYLTIGDTNNLFQIQIIAYGSHTDTPDTNIKLCVGGVQIA